MNEQEKESLKKLIIKAMMDYKGPLIDRVKAANYVNIDAAGPTVAEEVIRRLEERFEVKAKDKGVVRWED